MVVGWDSRGVRRHRCELSARDSEDGCDAGNDTSSDDQTGGILSFGADASRPARLTVVKERGQVSVYWNALNASYVYGALPFVPELLASRAHTEKRYGPAGWPGVFHMNVLLLV